MERGQSAYNGVVFLWNGNGKEKSTAGRKTSGAGICERRKSREQSKTEKVIITDQGGL